MGSGGQKRKRPKRKKPLDKAEWLLMLLVGATGFEPATSATPLQRATKLRHAPTLILGSAFRLLCPENEAYTSARCWQWEAP